MTRILTNQTVNTARELRDWLNGLGHDLDIISTGGLEAILIEERLSDRSVVENIVIRHAI